MQTYPINQIMLPITSIFSIPSPPPNPRKLHLLVKQVHAVLTSAKPRLLANVGFSYITICIMYIIFDKMDVGSGVFFFRDNFPFKSIKPQR